VAKPAAPADLPDLAQEAAREPYAARPAAENDDVAAAKCGLARQIDDGFAVEPGTVEEDGLGRQEFEHALRRWVVGPSER
jgi:hypothetical protein